MWFVPVIFYIFVGQAYIHSKHHYDAPIPEQCATFEQAHADENREYCTYWFDEHRR